MNIGLIKLKKQIELLDMDGLLVSDKKNRIYISGFTGSSAVIFISKNREIIITDSRYIEQIKQQAPDFEVIDHYGHFSEALVNLLKRENVRNVGFESDYMNVSQYLELKKSLPDIEFIPTINIIERLRSVKEDYEIEQMKIAAEITDQVFGYFLKIVKPGMTELEVAAKIDYYMREQGASDRAFETIVASGLRSSLPHGHASDKKIQKNELVMIDFGVVYNRYYSDITRTIAIGNVPDKLKEVYNIVKKAQKTGIEAIKSGSTCSDIDSSSRAIIEKAGYGCYFGHGTGHGIGLSCHEYPQINKESNVKLLPGMTFTVEPGIYIPNLGGVRIEDDILVNKGFNAELLTKSTKDWIEI
ncbi:Xaa-Pro peptidase family protein [Caldifermentibacillus hisashii]|uniref:M24 family metallopeptidase n=1 Tax=Caldifermentibacillus hisashii TaxID=996558 RepID=UPI0031FDA178